MSRVRKVAIQAKSQWEEYLDYFLLFKKAQGLAERTLSDYKEHVTKFFKVSHASIEDYNGLKLAVLKYFAESASLSPYTFNTRRKLLKVFFSWAASEGIITENPVNIKKRKEDEVPRAVNQGVITQLLSIHYFCSDVFAAWWECFFSPKNFGTYHFIHDEKVCRFK
jgi:site-specific recombinase XerD